MDKIALKEFLQKKYESPAAFLENVIFPVFGEENYDSSGNYHWLHKHPEDQTAADIAGIVDILVLGSLYVEGSQLDLFDITVSSKRQLATSRVGIQQLVRRIISSHSGAFMIFHYQTTEHWDWRFTFCHKGANQLDSSDTKRYTFLLGPGQSCRTAAENFFKLGEKISGSGEFEMEDIIKAFDVEALSKEFFAKYKVHYDRFCQFVYDNKDNREYFGPEFSAWEDKIIRDYVKKLLGRIVFLHFLQKKGWLGVPAGGQWGDGDPQFMKHLFEASSDEQKQNYLDAVLEPLFSGALNVQRENDVFNLNVPGYTEIRIPYLNGGLFERDELDEPASAFPADYFADLFEFFYQYNFTIDENDPDDAEVGIDPEMLGRIFENLLEDNKDKGAYYTPKEIVQYMCRESLIAYLTTCFMERNGSFARDRVETEVRRLVKNPETKVPEMNQQAKEDFGNDLRKVRICDPAIGSGAFPMGLLNELVRCRVAIDAWAKDNSGRLLTGDYAALKREIINNNIYGVDIERGAIDIARLRFWLSIVVDEQAPQPLPNLDYKFMQGNSLITTFNGEYINLDTKGQQHIRVEDMKREKAHLYELKQRYYSANGESKYQLDVEIKDSILSLISMQLGYEIRTWYDKNAEQLALFSDDTPKQLSFADMKEQLPADKQKVMDLGASLRKQLSDTTKSLAVRAQTDIRFFDWRIMFTEVFEGENPGFDIVIGNPPYIKEYTNRNAFDGFRENSQYYMGKMDIWYGFACHGIDLLKSNGTLCFIAQNNWTTSTGARKMRAKIVSDARIVQMLDFNDYMVFGTSASIQTMVMLFTKDSQCDEYALDYRKLQTKSKKHDMIDLLARTETSQTYYLYPTFSRETFTDSYITFSDNDALLLKIANQPGRLLETELTQGIVPNPDVINSRNIKHISNKSISVGEGVFVIEKGKFSHLSSTEQKYIQPVFEPSNMDRYYLGSSSSDIIYITNKNWKDDAPVLKEHLSRYKEIMELRRENQLGRIHFYQLHWPRDEEFFENGPKILSVRKCLHPTFVYTEVSTYVMMAVNVIKTERWNNKFLTGVLNSSLIEYWLSSKGKRQGENYQIDKEPLMSIPLPSGSCEQNRIATIVDRIISMKAENPNVDTKIWENEIDKIVYHLYSLTYDEVLVIDPETPITREEYSNFQLN